MYNLVKKMVEEKKTHSEIAAATGKSRSCIASFCSRNGLVSRKKPTPKYDVDLIRKLIEVDRLQQHRVAEIIGVDRATIERACRRYDIKTQRTGPRTGSNYGENNPAWKGGRTQHKGYTRLRMPEHPFSDKGGYYDEHRFVAEQILGRYLTSDEVVHHIDECRSNNNPSNLVLFANNTLHLTFHELMIATHHRSPYVFASWLDLLKKHNYHSQEESYDGLLLLGEFHQKN